MEPDGPSRRSRRFGRFDFDRKRRLDLVKDFILAVGQWPVVASKERNLDRAEAFLEDAAREGAALCVLPEMFQTPYDLESMRTGAEDASGPSLERIRGIARRLSIHVVAGSFSERVGGVLHNSAHVVGPTGDTLGVHRKIHLFDVDLPGVRVVESAVFQPGNRPCVVELPFATIGVCICYDLRFPAVFEYFEDRGVEVVVAPAAFSRVTGAAHWHVLLRARAIDHQVYVAAACPAPLEGSEYQAFGHSLIVDPWGEVLAEAQEGPERILATLRRQRLEEVRRSLPLLRHRKRSLYEEWRGHGPGGAATAP